MRQNSNLGNARGFTMVEMLISMTIMTIIGLIVLQFARATNRTERQERLSMQAQQSARLAIDRMSEEVRMGSPLTLDPAPGRVGDFQSPLLQFQTITWDAVNNVPLNSVWIEYRTTPGTPTQLERVTYCGGCPPAPANIATVTIVSQNIYDEDLDDDGVLDPGEDLNNDGLLQRGLWFTVNQEDNNNNDFLTSTEDINANDRMDATVGIQVDTQVLNPTLNGRGFATVTTVANLRN